jgi:hypothetical protein
MGSGNGLAVTVMVFEVLEQPLWFTTVNTFEEEEVTVIDDVVALLGDQL